MDERVVLVTGGARGIGAGIATAFAQQGCRVMVADIGIGGSDADWDYEFANDADLEALQAHSDRIHGTHVDVTDSTSCETAVAATLERFGQLDVLVNNAGVIDSGPIAELPESAWDRIFDVNCKGIFLMTRAALPHLKDSSDAAVVNIASIAGKQGHANLSAYCGSKFAAIGITQSFAGELAPDGIRVNALCPGIVGTAMWFDHLFPSNATSRDQLEDEFETSMQQRIPLGRAQTIDDMGQAAVYLATATNVSGVALNVAGGLEMH